MRWAIRLDGRPVKTPARAPLTVPTRALAESTADEWRSVRKKSIRGRCRSPALPMRRSTGSHPTRRHLRVSLARYAEADLTCYRADGPQPLVDRQQQHWDALLGWARRRFDVDFATTSGLMHVAQPKATVERLAHAVAALDTFRLAGLSPLVTISGSLIAALAVVEKAITPELAWDAVTVDERWHAERWGADAEAEQALENRRRDFFAAARFLELLSSDGPPALGRSSAGTAGARGGAARRR